MVEAFVNFWKAFFNHFADIFKRRRKEPVESEAQAIEDISQINFLAIVSNTLNNLANCYATFDLDTKTENAQIQHLKELCEKLEQNRYQITDEMLTKGDYFVFPTTDEQGVINNSFLPLSRVRIVEIDDTGIKELYAIIDTYKDENNKDYMLVRHHKLLPDGTLEIEHLAEAKNGEPASVAKWSAYTGNVLRYINANHIGVGRYKSPANSRGLSPVYGVPLNFGCASLEEAIFNDIEMINREMENGKSLIFTDPRNVVPDGTDYKFANNIIPINSKVGLQSQIDIYNPSLRFTPYYENLVADLSMLERQIGVSKGILTENETSYTATATAVKRANADTIAMINKIRDAIDIGNKDTLIADCVFMNVRTDQWKYVSDWYDAYEDAGEQYERIRLGIENGYAEKADGTRWLFPSLDEEQIQEKLARIAAEQARTADTALDNLLNNGA